MEMIEKKENKVVFRASIDDTTANAIRRYIGHINVMAIDEVEIHMNNSPLYDETVAHRVGLIPLETEKTVNEKSTGVLKLKTDKEGVVYSKEFKGTPKPVYDSIPITILNKGQEIEIVANVKAGKGHEHAKFSPGFMFYREIVDVKVDKDCPQDILTACKKNTIKTEAGKTIIGDIYGNGACEVAIEKHMKEKKVNMSLVPTGELLVSVESFGQMPPQEMFKKAIEALKKDLNNVGKAL